MGKYTLQPPANTNIIPSQVLAETFKPAVNNQNPVAVSTNITLKKVLSFKARALKKALKLTIQNCGRNIGCSLRLNVLVKHFCNIMT